MRLAIKPGPTRLTTGTLAIVRAILSAASMASDPPLTKYTWLMPSGAVLIRRSASCSATWVVKKPVWA